MSVEVSFFISIMVLMFGGIIAFYRLHKLHTPLKNSLTLFLFSVILAIFPIYLLKHQTAEGGFLDTVFLSLISSMQSISSNNAVLATRDLLKVDEQLWWGFAIYTSALHFIALLLVGGILLSFLRNLVPQIKYIFSFGQLCIFTELSERSYLLAKNIRENEKDFNSHHVIIFLNTNNEEDHSLYSPKDIRELNAIFFNKDSTDFKILPRFHNINIGDNSGYWKLFWQTILNYIKIKLRIKQAKDFSEKEKVHFFLLSLDDSKNLQSLFKLSEKYNNKNYKGKILAHVLSDLPESENIADSIECSGNLTIRLIKESRAIFYELFDKRPLFLGRRGNTLKILVIGAGRNGLEAVKIASWCGQTIDLRPEILVIDNNPKVEKQFAYDCPELASTTAPDFAKSESRVNLHIMDINTPEFLDFLRQHLDIGYIICAIGDDELSLRTSLKIRSVFAEKPSPRNAEFTLPLIHSLLNNNFLAENIKNLKFDLRDNCYIYPFGNLAQRYTWDNIVSPYFASAGRAVNRFYEKEYSKDQLNSLDENELKLKIKELEQKADLNYENKEYNRASSVAAAVHAKYKIYSLITELLKQEIDFDWAEKPNKKLLDIYSQNFSTFETELAKLEHTRWNVYMRSLGWRNANLTEMENWFPILNNHRNFSAKLHPCLDTWEKLEEVDNWLQKSQHRFQDLDIALVKRLVEILENTGK